MVIRKTYRVMLHFILIYMMGFMGKQIYLSNGRIKKQKREIAGIENRIAMLRIQKNAHGKELVDFKNMKSIEKIARNRLYMKKEGETIYRFVER